MMVWLFWSAAALVVFAYIGYPLVLWLGARLTGAGVTRTAQSADDLPRVSLIIPAHNERPHIGAKLENVFALDYPPDRLEIIVVSDGSTDGTSDVVRDVGGARVVLVEVTTRGGKAGALNAGLERASHDLIVFSDAAILFPADALRNIVAPFADQRVGCVSGEDRIANSGGEAMYGRYELFIRRQESVVSSIVGASGCFYAQRRALCDPFVPTLAPDFLSVLRTVEAGYRAISEPSATGTMSAVDRAGDEFSRKVRTLLRGMTTLARFPNLLNPLRNPVYAFELWSHKVLRWFVPIPLIAMLLASAVLAADSWLYRAMLGAQFCFYGAALIGLNGHGALARSLPAKAAVFFVVSNAAAAVAWFKFALGERQELWTPSRRVRHTEPL